MKTISCLLAMLLSTTALASCPAGPYGSYTNCPSQCIGFQRCGDLNYVVCQLSSYLVAGTKILISSLYCHCLSIVALRRRANCDYRSDVKMDIGIQYRDAFIARTVDVWRSLHRHITGVDMS